MLYSGSSCGVAAPAAAVDNAGFAVGICAAGVGDGDGVGVGDGYGADAGSFLEIASLPLLLAKGGGTGLLLPLNLPGYGAEFLPYTYMKNKRAYTRAHTHTHTLTHTYTHIHTHTHTHTHTHAHAHTHFCKSLAARDIHSLLPISANLWQLLTAPPLP